MTDLNELADLCERAAGPDKALNRAIARAVGWGYQTPSEAKRSNPAWFHPDDCRGGKPVFDSLHGTDVWREPSDYVGTLDAAKTVVPQGWKMRQMNCSAPCADDRSWHINLHGGREGEDTFVGRGPTIELALCAAALRARAATPVQVNEVVG